jgi:glycosyltransferase involved in cell wall biosynthesis
MKRKRLLILTLFFPPEKNGLSQASFVMAQSFAKRGYEVTVATTQHPERNESPIPGVEVVDFAIQCEPGWLRRFSGETDRFTRFLKQDRWDWIVCHGWIEWPFQLSSPLLSGLRAKSVLVSHGFDCHRWTPRWQPPWGLGLWLRRLPSVLQLPWALRRFDWVTFLSARCDLKHYFDRTIACLTGFRRHSVIPNGVDPDTFKVNPSNFRERYGIAPGDFVFLYVAYYSVGKNQGLAARAFRRARLKNATLVFIGGEFNAVSHAFQEQDRQMTADYPDGRILWLEKVPRELTCNAFFECDAFVMTSKLETQPIVLLEAMAAGKPFLSTDVGCAADLPGGVIAHGEKEIAEAMHRLASERDYGHSLGLLGKKAVEETYQMEKVMDSYERLLVKLLDSEAAS